MANGQAAEAANQFAAATAASPLNGEAHYFHGEALTRLNQMEEALKEFAKAAELLPQDLNAHLNYGVALARTRQFQSALRELESVLRLSPGHELAKEYANAARRNLRQ
jgi:tetratricopeptide (TPR) repeat protein